MVWSGPEFQDKIESRGIFLILLLDRLILLLLRSKLFFVSCLNIVFEGI